MPTQEQSEQQRRQEARTMTDMEKRMELYPGAWLRHAEGVTVQGMECE